MRGKKLSEVVLNSTEVTSVLKNMSQSGEASGIKCVFPSESRGKVTIQFHGVMLLNRLVAFGQHEAVEPEMLRLTYTSVLTPIWGVDMEGRINVWNEAMTNLTKSSLEEMSGLSIRDVARMEPEFAAQLDAAMKQPNQNVGSAVIKYSIDSGNGKTLAFMGTLSSRYSASGIAIGVVCIGQVHEEGAEQYIGAGRIIETANAPIMGFDRQNRATLWNAKAAEITQYSPQEVIGLDFVPNFIAPPHRQAVAAILRATIEEGKRMANYEVPFVAKSGKEVQMLLHTSPRYSPTGEIEGGESLQQCDWFTLTLVVVVIAQDITKRMAQQSEYERYVVGLFILANLSILF